MGRPKKTKPKRPDDPPRDELGRFLSGNDLPWRNVHPRSEPQPGDADQIYRLATSGHGVRSIASHIQIGLETFMRWLKEHKEIKFAYQAGLAEEEQEIVTELRKILKGGNATPGIFLLKARHGWREGESQVEDNRVQISVQLPASLTPDQYKQVIDVTRKQELPGGGDDG